MTAPADVLDLDAADQVLIRSRRAGAGWAELFAERTTSVAVTRQNGRSQAPVPVLGMGAAVRALRGGVMVHAHATGLHPGSIEDLAGEVGRMLAATGPGSGPTPATPGPDAGGPAVEHPLPPLAGLEELLVRAEDAARNRCPGARRVTCTVTAESRVRAVVSTATPVRADAGTSLHLTVEVVAERAGSRRRASRAWGGNEPLDPTRHGPLAEQVAAAAAGSAERLLAAGPVHRTPGAVVFAPGVAGLLVHEVCGHLLEGDVVAAGRSVLGRQPGSRVAAPELTVVDDGRDPAVWGCERLDDEGTPAGRAVLVEDGVLAGTVHDLRSAAALGAGPTGHGRRRSYASAPVPRLRCTVIRPGADAPEAVLADTQLGLYVVSLGNGEVDPASGRFAFTLAEAYEVEDGRIGRAVTGAGVSGRAAECLAGIDAIGPEVAYQQARCKKAGQVVPVSFGAPLLRVRGLTVGGRRA